MHLRPDHTVRDLPTLHSFIRAHPLGVLTTSLPSENFPTLQCSHIPWVLDVETETGTETCETPEAFNGNDSTTASSLGILRGHIARANPQTAAMIEAVTDARPANTSTGESNPNPNLVGSADQTQAQHQNREYVLPGEVLIIFASPVDHYISPHFYTAAKSAAAAASAGKAKIAPTWNYAAVQVYGHSYLIWRFWGEEGVMGFSNANAGANGGGGESEGGGQSPWKLSDAPENYITLLKKNIVGIQVEITRVEGRFKVSQEKGVGDRGGVVDGLEKIGGGRARRMAEFVRKGRVV
ncbi:FMN-binding split barrel-related protein [Penicillium subrubescens]|uniref:FMN-binding split barrel-related protein n=1 Tax=Penicillium subrubescens TaxID=1316194 RepID=UPI002544DBB9|nr:FMN-binding split barrel-related protein [Penicillium subrubescens]KAJ5875709.1 FMN-binding split barrel-related protein [Penicillium subrubescens]